MGDGKESPRQEGYAMTQPADARPGGTPALAGPAAPEHRWLILGVIALAQLMIVLDATIMNIALPTAQRDLGFSIVDRQWVVTAYALAFGSLLWACIIWSVALRCSSETLW